MLKIAIISILLLSLAGTAVASNAIGSSGKPADLDGDSNSGLAGEMMPNGENLGNESVYGDFLVMAQAMYVEDYNFSESILKQYVNKTISNRDAMVATTSVFILTSSTSSMLETTEPPAEYAIPYNHTLLALLNLRSFLWNISKLFETNKSMYLNQSRKNLNDSLEYYKKAHEELGALRAAGSKGKE